MRPGPLAMHVFGSMIWFAGLMTALHTMRGYEASAVRGDFDAAQGNVGRIMDLGATMTLLSSGVLLTFDEHNRALLKLGAFHVKLAAVVGLFVIHGLVRIRLRRFSEGEVAPVPRPFVPVSVALYFVIIYMVIAKPF